MMLLNKDNNTVVVTLENGDEILFHHATPVAGYTQQWGYFKSTVQHSVTTSRKVAQYLNGYGDVEGVIHVVDQGLIEKFVDAI